MIGKPFVGLRIDDLIRGLDVLRERGLLFDGECLGFAKGTPGVDLLHAAILDARISGVLVEGGLVSYAAIARTPIHRQVFEAVIPGVLGKYDLPDLVAALAPRPVKLVNVRSPLGTPVSLRETQSEYGYAQTAYATAGAVSQLHVALRREGESVAAAYPALR